MIGATDPGTRSDAGDPGCRVVELLRGADSPVRLVARGFCMEPLLRDGDVVVVLPTPGRLEVGDVVLAGQAADDLVCHRLLAREGESYLLAGDRSLAIDRVDRSAIHGVVRRIEREGRLRDLESVSALGRGWLVLHLWCARRRGTLRARILNRLRNLGGRILI